MRFRQSQSLREPLHYGVEFRVSLWALVRIMVIQQLQELTFIGPAHAVYFATYEVVKQAMGGNEGTEHHPLAAGNSIESRACIACFSDVER